MARNVICRVDIFTHLMLRTLVSGAGGVFITGMCHTTRWEGVQGRREYFKFCQQIVNHLGKNH